MENWHDEGEGSENFKQRVAQSMQKITVNNPLCQRCKALRTKLDQQEKLKEFARHVIEVECWSLHDQDGGDLQELAEKLGLIELHTATEEDVADNLDFEVGDPICKFTKVLLPESEVDK